MDVIVQLPDDANDIVTVISKGADSHITKHCLREGAKETSLFKETKAVCDVHSDQGLRTLFMAQGKVTMDNFLKWKEEYQAAKNRQDFPSEEAKQKELERIEESLERGTYSEGMDLIGSTAIEDKLQVNVGSTLSALRTAGVATWVLTGDKVGTAIMIGMAAELLTKEMHQILCLEHTEIKDAEGNTIEFRVNSAQALIQGITEGVERERDYTGKMALVVEGGALMTLGIGQDSKWWAGQAGGPSTPEAVESYRKLQETFIKQAGQCHAVLCCRVSPKQKADVTRLVKTHLEKTTLGIGDGANDVGMILEADVGVGIQGVEGSQAVNSADFALTQFQHLANLLFLHGRWTYRRLSRAIVYFFYKNMIPTLTILLYVVTTGFSGSALYNEMIISGYNLVFTSLPIVVFALLEQDVPAGLSLQNPIMYEIGQKGMLLNCKIFSMWIADSVYASFICFFFPWFSQGGDKDGRILSFGMVSITMFTVVLLVVTFRLALDTQFWTWMHHLTYWGSLVVWFVFIMIECAVPGGFITDGSLYWDFFNAASCAYFWLLMPLVVVSCCVTAYLYRTWNNIFLPDAVEQVRQQMAIAQDEKQRDLEDRRKTAQGLDPDTVDLWRPENFDNAPANHREVNTIHLLQRRYTVGGEAISAGAQQIVNGFKRKLTMRLHASQSASLAPAPAPTSDEVKDI